jgi:hypothetical protein
MGRLGIGNSRLSTRPVEVQKPEEGPRQTSDNPGDDILGDKRLERYRGSEEGTHQSEGHRLIPNGPGRRSRLLENTAESVADSRGPNHRNDSSPKVCHRAR